MYACCCCIQGRRVLSKLYFTDQSQSKMTYSQRNSIINNSARRLNLILNHLPLSWLCQTEAGQLACCAQVPKDYPEINIKVPGARIVVMKLLVSMDRIQKCHSVILSNGMAGNNIDEIYLAKVLWLGRFSFKPAY